MTASAPSASDIEALVLGAIENMNLARRADSQLAATAEAPLFGAGSPLDSIGLVSLLIDIEDSLLASGWDVQLSDASAMSESRSPFRSVPALVAYIQGQLAKKA